MIARISSAVFASGDHAYWLRAATPLNRDHSSETTTWCSSTERPARARRADSNMGYTWVGMTRPRACSASLVPGWSVPNRSGAGVSSDCFDQSSQSPVFLASNRV